MNKIYHDEDLTLIWPEYLNQNLEMIYNSYINLGFLVDSSSTKMELDSTEFDVLDLIVKDKDFTILMYHRLYKRYYPEKKSEFVINVTY